MRTLGLRRALSATPEKVEWLAYRTLDRPKLEYAVEVWDTFLVKHILQSIAVRFVGNLKGRGGVSKKGRNWVLTYWLTGKKNMRLSMFHFISTQSTRASYNELNELTVLYHSCGVFRWLFRPTVGHLLTVLLQERPETWKLAIVGCEQIFNCLLEASICMDSPGFVIKSLVCFHQLLLLC